MQMHIASSLLDTTCHTADKHTVKTSPVSIRWVFFSCLVSPLSTMPSSPYSKRKWGKDARKRCEYGGIEETHFLKWDILSTQASSKTMSLTDDGAQQDRLQVNVYLQINVIYTVKTVRVQSHYYCFQSCLPHIKRGSPLAHSHIF